MKAGPFLAVLLLLSAVRGEEPIPPIPRVLPPEGGLELPPPLREALLKRLETLRDRVFEIEHKPRAADAAVLVKAVDLALRHGEFYSEKEFPRAAALLDLAETRCRALDEGGELSWLAQRGPVARGYRSSIDDSFQPYGLEIPESLDLSKPVPLLVWLHGRGDKATDLHFLHQCLTKLQAFGGFWQDQSEAIVLHPFGRHCVGWKHAGEIDVFEAIEAVKADYPVDPDRILLAGFSMGGAGAWHLGAHYRDQFCGIHAGAGFVETKEYNRLTPDQYPPVYEQTLWQVYDVPAYLRNLRNGPLLAYSGALDKQKAAADLMARELATIGHELRHIVAPETEHKYTAAAVAEIRRWLSETWREGRRRPSRTIEWQTPTLRYGRHDWLQLTGLERHWSPSTVRAGWDPAARKLSIETKGVTALAIGPGLEPGLNGVSLDIDGRELKVENPGFPVHELSLVRRGGQWSWGEPARLSKRPGLQGPIDDAFLSRFLVVPPEHPPEAPALARWTAFELDHFRNRWSALMRGTLPEKGASEVDSRDLREANLILWGDPASNPLIAEMADRLPVTWTEDRFTLQGEGYPRDSHVPVLIFPNPLNPERYVVLNSGLTFREGHDRTNSQQNPKLPDWAVLALDRDPDALAPGRVVAAGFFGESWE